MRKGAPAPVYEEIGLSEAVPDAQDYLIALKTGWTLEYIRGLTAADHTGLLGFVDGLNRQEAADG